MKLSIIDRLVVIEILPRQGDIVTMNVVKDLLDKIRIKETDIKKYSVKQTIKEDGGTTITWDDTKAKQEIEYLISNAEQVMIVEILKRINVEKKLTLLMLPTYNKFMNIEPDKKKTAKK